MKQENKSENNNQTKGLIVDGRIVPVSPDPKILSETAANNNHTSKQQSKRRLIKYKIRSGSNLSVVLWAFVLLIITILGFTALTYIQKNFVAIKVGKQVVTNRQYDNFKTQYKKYYDLGIKNDEELKQYVVNALKYTEAAKTGGISISDFEVSDYISANYREPTGDWLALVARGELSKIAIENSKNKGYYAKYVIPFCKGFVMDLATAKGYGDEAKILADQQAAKSKIEKYKEQITKDPSVDLAKKHVDEILANKDLDYGFAGNQSRVFQLTNDNRQYESPSSSSDLSDEDLAIIKQLGDNSPISQVYTQRRAVSIIPKYSSADTPIAYYFFIKLESKGANFDFKKYMDNLEVSS